MPRSKAQITRSAYLATFIALLVFLQGSISHWTAPGLYMDAVNPDYVIVRLLNRNADIEVWSIPGTYIGGIFPTIVQVYHGALPFYIGMPVYALLGAGVFGVRMANFVFGSIVVIAASIFLGAFRVRPLFVGLTLTALALDPGFLFSFRTQFYITLLPIAALLLSVAIVENAGSYPSRRSSFAAGLLAGLSIYGYFIYLFLSPVAAAHLYWKTQSNLDRRRLLIAWIAGFALGVSPYLVGYVLTIIATGGVQVLGAFFATPLSTPAAGSFWLGIWRNLKYFVDIAYGSIFFAGPSSVMLGRVYRPYLGDFKTVLLIVVAGLYLIADLLLIKRITGIKIIAGFLLGMAVLFLVFGNRLWFHHAAALLPLLYLSLALSLEFMAAAAPSGRWAAPILLLPLLALGIGNAIDRRSVMLDLERTGGVGLASDAIERFAEDSLKNADPTYGFFPDWGIFMPFEMVTGGRIPVRTTFAPREARRKLCEGRDVLLAIVNAQGTGRLAAWIDAVGWGSPEVRVYRQRDAAPVLTSVRWRASDAAHPACAS